MLLFRLCNLRCLKWDSSIRPVKVWVISCVALAKWPWIAAILDESMSAENLAAWRQSGCRRRFITPGLHVSSRPRRKARSGRVWRAHMCERIPVHQVGSTRRLVRQSIPKVRSGCCRLTWKAMPLVSKAEQCIYKGQRYRWSRREWHFYGVSSCFWRASL